MNTQFIRNIKSRRLEGKRTLGGHRCRWKENVKMDLEVTEWERVR
jgi:hypothetical protein